MILIPIYLLHYVCTLIYVLSAIEVIGSWILTVKYQHIRWNLEFIILPLLIPLLTPIAAYDSMYYANMLYINKKYNKHHWQESFYLWLKYDRLSINQWAEKHHSKSNQ